MSENGLDAGPPGSDDRGILKVCRREERRRQRRIRAVIAQFKKNFASYYLIRYLCLFLSYLILASLITYPLILHPRTKIAGELNFKGDVEGALWLNYHIKRVITGKDSLTRSTLQFHPFGKDLLTDLGNFLTSILSLPLQFLLPLPAYYNLFLLLLLSLNSISIAPLLLRITGRWSLIFIGGLIFGMNPFILREAYEGRVIQVAVLWIPISILYSLDYIRSGGKRLFIASLIFLLLAGLSYWYWALFVFIFLILSTLYSLRLKEVLRAGFLMIGFSLSILPFTYPVIERIIHDREIAGLPPSVYPVAEKGNEYIAHLLANSYDITSLILSDGSPDPLKILPLSSLLLIISIPLFSKDRGYLLLLLPFSLLASGPKIKLFTENFLDIPLLSLSSPYLILYKYLPLFYRLSRPDRFLVMLYLVLALLFVLTMQRVYALFHIRKWSEAILFSISLSFVSFLIPLSSSILPFPISDFSIPQFYYDIRKEKGGGGIIDLPIGYTQTSVLFQIVHEKRTLGGCGDGAEYLLPGYYKDFLKENSFLRYLKYPEESFFSLDHYREVRRHGFTYAVLHLDFPYPSIDRGKRERLQEYHIRTLKWKLERFSGPPIYKDQKIMVYLLPESLNTDIPSIKKIGSPQ